MKRNNFKTKLCIAGLCIGFVLLISFSILIKISIIRHLGFPWWYMLFVGK